MGLSPSRQRKSQRSGGWGGLISEPLRRSRAGRGSLLQIPNALAVGFVGFAERRCERLVCQHLFSSCLPPAKMLSQFYQLRSKQGLPQGDIGGRGELRAEGTDISLAYPRMAASAPPAQGGQPHPPHTEQPAVLLGFSGLFIHLFVCLLLPGIHGSLLLLQFLQG